MLYGALVPQQPQNVASGERWKLLAKLAVGAAILAYAIRTARLDPREILGALRRPESLALNVAFCAAINLVLSLRWRIILARNGIPVKLRRCFEFNLIAGVFGQLVAGSVAGDAVRAVYASGLDPGKRVTAMSTVALDRILSAAVMLVFALVVFAESPMGAIVQERVPAVALGVRLLPWAALVAVAAAFIAARTGLGARIEPHLKALPFGSKLVEILSVFRCDAGTLLVATLLSLASILTTVLLYAIQGRILGIPLGLSAYLVLVPFGTILSYLAMVPYGIGVTQLFYAGAFAWFGGARPEDGVVLCTLIQTYSILFHLSGGYFFLRRS